MKLPRITPVALSFLIPAVALTAYVIPGSRPHSWQDLHEGQDRRTIRKIVPTLRYSDDGSQWLWVEDRHWNGVWMLDVQLGPDSGNSYCVYQIERHWRYRIPWK
jgi:hypothetical protein